MVSIFIGGSWPKLSTAAASIAAAVGVRSSARIGPPDTGRPFISSAVAGAGTGILP